MGQITTLVAQRTRYVMLVKANGRDTETVINALIKSNKHTTTGAAAQVADPVSRQ